MPTTPKRTKKALQEVAKVFNKLASELTADLNSAVKEIENLRKEVRRIKSSPGIVKSASGSKKPITRGTKSTRVSNKNAARNVRTETAHGSKTTHDTPKPSHETSSFVFPHEPFNPSPPPEPTPPGNN